jgi:hypothetical protein
LQQTRIYAGREDNYNGDDGGDDNDDPFDTRSIIKDRNMIHGEVVDPLGE